MAKYAFILSVNRCDLGAECSTYTEDSYDFFHFILRLDVCLVNGWKLELGLNGIFLGLNGIDFFGFFGFK
ncbi:MAG: hypothetical protein RLZZ628_543 [Bacteroidota bacterium]|jgi:hypothetical protein